MNYDFWKASLAGEKPKMFVDDPQLGFYRKPIKERDDKGNNKRVGWSAVAIFLHDGIPTARITSGSYVHDVIGDGLNDLWSYVAGNPISESEYRQVAEEGMRWSDATEISGNIPAANRDVTATDNAPAETIPLVKAHAIAIKTAVDAAIKKVASNEDAATALGTKNRIAELRLAADKDGKAEYEPIYRDYKRIQGEYAPIIKLAEGEEKRLNTAILTFRESERKRIAAEQAEADNAQRELDEANARAADRAIARGEPEEPPEVVEAAPVQVAAPIAPTYGTRVIKEQMKTFLDEVEDFDLVYNFFKVQSRGQVETFLKDLAERAIKAGFEVPGTKTRKGLI